MNRSLNMAAIKSKDTNPELAVRRLIHKMGFRYRLHQSGLPGKPDLVFPSRKKTIFVHGCFWHSHNCKKAHLPKSNKEYWLPKLQRNQSRDLRNAAELTSIGWEHLIIWECEIKHPEDLEKRLNQFLGVLNKGSKHAQKVLSHPV